MVKAEFPIRTLPTAARSMTWSIGLQWPWLLCCSVDREKLNFCHKFLIWLYLIATYSQKIKNKLSGRKFDLFDDVISVEKGDLGPKM